MVLYFVNHIFQIKVLISLLIQNEVEFVARELLKYVWDKKFNFLYLDTGNSFNKMYHKNFNTLELHTRMDELTDLGEGGK